MHMHEHEQQGLTQVGRRWRTRERVVERTEMIDFAHRWDPLPAHIDEQAARTSRFGDVIASGLFTLAIYQRLAAEDVYAGQPIVAARRLREVRFIRPLFAGERVSAVIEVVHSQEGRGGGLDVTVRGALVAGADDEVLTLEVDLVLAGSM